MEGEERERWRGREERDGGGEGGEGRDGGGGTGRGGEGGEERWREREREGRDGGGGRGDGGGKVTNVYFAKRPCLLHSLIPRLPCAMMKGDSLTWCCGTDVR